MKITLKKLRDGYYEIERTDNGISGEFHEDESLGDILEMLKEQR